jgi:flagellar FliL protein
MAEEVPQQPTEEKTEKEPGTLKKVLLVGVPAFLVQLVLVYFLTARFLVPLSLQNAGALLPAHASPTHTTGNETTAAESSAEAAATEEHLFVIKDLIINPAGTNGQRYLLTTIGFNLSSEEARKEMEKKELAVRDALNSVLTSKGMEDLIDVSKRELLRQEIFMRCKELVKTGKLQSVYFSKYIIQ